MIIFTIFGGDIPFLFKLFTMAFQKKYNLIHSEISYKIIGCAYKVHNELGGGHLENVYQKAMAIALSSEKLEFVEQKNLPIVFLDNKLTRYRPDFIVEEKVVIDLKRTKKLLDDDFDQAFRYLQLTNHQLALLIHFGKEFVTKKRVVNLQPPIIRNP